MNATGIEIQRIAVSLEGQEIALEDMLDIIGLRHLTRDADLLFKLGEKCYRCESCNRWTLRSAWEPGDTTECEECVPELDENFEDEDDDDIDLDEEEYHDWDDDDDRDDDESYY